VSWGSLIGDPASDVAPTCNDGTASGVWQSLLCTQSVIQDEMGRMVTFL
jgi:hypothetical protein